MYIELHPGVAGGRTANYLPDRLSKTIRLLLNYLEYNESYTLMMNVTEANHMTCSSYSGHGRYHSAF